MQKKHIFTFSTNEHKQIGDSTKLQTIKADEKLPMFYYKNGQAVKIDDFELSFGDIVALGGDYYAPINIGSKKDDPNAEQLFLQAFNSLSNTNEKPVVEKIFAINKDAKTQNQYITQLRYLFLLGKKYFTLTSDNLDHFSPWSKNAYEIGHNLALKIAQQGYDLRNSEKESDKQQSLNYLHLAYQINAFACHYLTDSFASGHLREGQLRQKLPKQFGFIGGILINNMHNEDNKFGVIVKNKKGTTWTAFGDDNYDKTKKDYTDLLTDVLTRSSKEIFDRYEHNIHKPSEVLDYLPEPDNSQVENGTQFPPMFRLNDNTIEYRDPIDGYSKVEYKKLSNIFEAIWLVIKLRIFPSKTQPKPPEVKPAMDNTNSFGSIRKSIKATDLILQPRNANNESATTTTASQVAPQQTLSIDPPYESSNSLTK